MTPTHTAHYINKQLWYEDYERFNLWLSQFKEGEELEVIVRKKKKSRTTKQNNSMHLYFEQLAVALNEAGYDMKKTLREDLDIPWSASSIKEHLWRPVQKTYLEKQSTTELTTIDIDKIYEIINREIANRTGVSIPWPSIESLMYEKS